MQIPEPAYIEVVFFDVGNTLLKPHPSMEAICRHVLEQFGYTATDEELHRGIIAADRYYEQRYWTDDSFWANEEDASEMWSQMYSLLLDEIGIDGDRAVMGRALYDYFGHGDRWRTFPDVVPVFERLRGAGYRLGLISNWDSRLAKLCFDMGLDRYLDSVVSSASIGLIKPDPHIFDVALERMGVAPERSVHVGDHYYADVLGARGAGIFPVLIDRWGMGHTADVPVIRDLYGLLPLLGIE
jgi:putative hydrolase of the HAD superfamily